jgi:hypothetical protein
MNNKNIQRDPTARGLFVLIIFILLGIAGVSVLRAIYSRAVRPTARWADNNIHVYSPKDGPWFITHLQSYQAGGMMRATAQLSTPVTILDSSGHYFTPEEIKAMIWTDYKGEVQTPPSSGDPIGVMYIVPSAGRPMPMSK